MKAAVKSVLFYLFLAVAAADASGEPAEVAVQFLEKVRSGELDLTPGSDTALSPITGVEKRLQIASRLKRLAQDLGDAPLEAGEVRQDDGHAAVLVYRVGGYDPARVQAFPIALVKQEGKWQPAPVPASFENTGIGYPALLRSKIKSMESWMLRQQVAGVESLRERLKERLKQDIRGHVELNEIRDLAPGDVGRRFIEACERRDLPRMLGFLGGLQTTLPEDWSQRLAAAEAAVSKRDVVPRPWRLLVAPEVVRTVVHEESEGAEALISVACLDPSVGTKNDSVPWVEVIHLELAKGIEGLWRIDPPQAFLEPGYRSEPLDREDQLDSELLDRFPENLRQQLPATPAKSLTEAVRAFSEGLRAENLNPLFALLDLEGDPGVARLGCSRLARAWQLLRDPATARHAVPVGFHEVGSAAVVVYQYFSSREPDRVDLKSFFFRKSTDGWLIGAGLKPEDGPQDAETAEVVAWNRENTSVWQKSWRSELLKPSVRLERIDGPAPTASDARRVVLDWLAATAKGDVAGALALTAWLGDERGAPRILRNLGYEIRTARTGVGEGVVQEVFPGEIFTTVGVRAGSPNEVLYPLYPVVTTPAGPRVLVEIDLFATAKRDYLNDDAVRRTRHFAAPEAVAELKTMLESYRSAVREPEE
jgi:hypothetical protein